ncbi:hypothetical protein KEM56_001736 [Ascosphaera pollenicola]|nr:hypothetical protein KEM56_001736 [Ascosphaera pollenicola]
MSHHDPSEEGDQNPSQESYHQIPPTTVISTGRSLQIHPRNLRDAPGAGQLFPGRDSLHPSHHALKKEKGDANEYEEGEIRDYEAGKAGRWSESFLPNMDEGYYFKSGNQDDEVGQADKEPESLDNMSTASLNSIDTPPTEVTRGHTPEQDNRSGRRVLREKPSSIRIRVPTTNNVSNISIDVDPTVMSDVRIEIGRGGPK